MEDLFRRAFGGGGNRGEARDIVRGADLAAKVVKDDRTIRREDDKSKTEAISRHSEAHSQSAEWLQKTRRSAGLFCNYLARLTRMRILQAKESSFLQYKAVAKNENNSTETDQASMPLGIFTSKLVSCRISKPDLHKKSAFTLAEGATHVAHCDKYRRVAFTLAEILITLGIIGVVAALTLPTLIQNNQKKQFQVGLQKGYSELLQALDAYKNDNGEPLTTKTCYGDTPGIFKNLIKPYLKVLVDCGDSQAVEIYDKCVQNGEYSKEGKYTYKTYSGKTAEERCFDDGQLVLTNGSILMFENPASYGRSVNVFVSIDVNGFKKGPNQWGVDLFTFQLMEDGKLLPMGMAGTYYAFQDNIFCNKASGNKRNGIACTSRALYDKDFWK